ncbi:MAG: hypothetical protein NTW19_12425, partial [Planctomycetota bacterium]|nr:hypothetical protein [Planctomycetota bacterium]
FLVIPCWFLTLVSLLPISLPWFLVWRKRRLIRPGCCAACGYDLRGSPADGDCPECGAVRTIDVK